MFISIFFATMAMYLGQQMSRSLLALYAHSLGASASSIGMLMSMCAVSSIIFRFISAPVMDTYNRKYVVMFAMTTLATAFFGFSISRSVMSLMGFRLLQGCGMAFGSACCLAMVAETIPKEKYGAGIGYYSMAQVMSQAIGPSVSLWLVDLVGFRTTYVINACIMLIAVLLASRIKTNFKQTKKLRISLNNIIAKEALLPASLQISLASGNATVNSFLIIFARYQGVTNIGFYFTVTALTMLFTRPIVGRLTDKYSFIKIFIPASLCNVLAFFVISTSHTIWSFLLAAFISAFGLGACTPAVQALTMKSVTNERRGAGSTTHYIGGDLGNLLSPIIAGSIAQSFGYVTMWHFMIAPFVIAICMVLIFRKKIAQIEQSFLFRQQSK